MKKIYRSVDERKIAGVCGGLAESFGHDPVFYRLLWLLLLAFGGIGVVAYGAMWILVPLRDAAGAAVRSPSRLRLSATDRRIVGVCGGLGEFLDVDPVLFRVAFIAFAVAGGVGLLLYIACWLVMPAATPWSSDVAGHDGGSPTAA